MFPLIAFIIFPCYHTLCAPVSITEPHNMIAAFVHLSKVNNSLIFPRSSPFPDHTTYGHLLSLKWSLTMNFSDKSQPLAFFLHVWCQRWICPGDFFLGSSFCHWVSSSSLVVNILLAIWKMLLVFFLSPFLTSYPLLQSNSHLRVASHISSPSYTWTRLTTSISLPTPTAPLPYLPLIFPLVA